MTTFKYKAINSDGAKVDGVIQAYNEAEAAAKIRETCIIITKIEEVKRSGTENKKPPKINEKSLSILCSQFSIIISAGLPIVTCIKMVAQQQKSKEVQNMLLAVAEDIDAGYSMAASFEKNDPELPRTFIETVRAGEISGTLDACFKRLQAYYEKSSKTKSKLVSALMYPALVIVIAIVVFVIIMVVAVPLFTETFLDMGTELPGITKALMAVSGFFTNYWWVLLMIAAVLGISYVVARKDEKGRLMLADFSLTKSPLRGMNSMNASASFAATMATMLSSGLPITECLRITASVIPNAAFADAVKKTQENVEQGGSMGGAMRESKYFPTMLTEMTSVGERSGTLESTLTVIGDYFSNEVDVATGRIVALIEPVITIVLALVTVVLLLAVYLPMFSMYGTV